MSQLELRLNLPAEVVALLGETPEAAAAAARRAVLLHLLREGRLSQGKVARLLGLSRHDLIDLMAAYDIPSGPATVEEWREELAGIDQLTRELQKPAE